MEKKEEEKEIEKWIKEIQKQKTIFLEIEIENISYLLRNLDLNFLKDPQIIEEEEFLFSISIENKNKSSIFLKKIIMKYYNQNKVKILLPDVADEAAEKNKYYLSSKNNMSYFLNLNELNVEILSWKDSIHLIKRIKYCMDFESILFNFNDFKAKKKKENEVKNLEIPTLD